MEHIKYLECRCEELGERNNNTVVESVNWRKKYFQVKEEVDRLSGMFLLVLLPLRCY